MLTVLLDNRRFRSWAGQIVLLGGFTALVLWLVTNTIENLQARGIKVGFDFLGRQANFPISESVFPYDPSDSFLWAYVTGLGNTIVISLIALFFSTLLGLIVGLARRSKHPLTAYLSGVFVTTARNMPLIVHLLFWYALATTMLPAPRQAFNPLPGVYLSLRGLYLPSVHLSGSSVAMLLALAVVILLAYVLRKYLQEVLIRLGYRLSVAPLFAVLLIAGVFIVVKTNGDVSVPEMKGFNFTGGFRLSPEFAALMIGLVIYTSAFIGEIIRGGIDAVSVGQWEAGRAVGLSERHVLTKVIIPQALRIIIPPMTSQYLSTIKNTTLALAVGYPELGLVVGTVINQTGQALESIAILLAVFLTLSISVSLFMNWYNARVALVEAR